MYLAKVLLHTSSNASGEVPEAHTKPLAVWNGDFADSAERGGFVLSFNGNASSDGSAITISNTSSGGIRFMQKVGGSSAIALSGVTVNGEPAAMKWRRKTADGVEGIYVIAGTMFMVY